MGIDAVIIIEYRLLNRWYAYLSNEFTFDGENGELAYPRGKPWLWQNYHVFAMLFGDHDYFGVSQVTPICSSNERTMPSTKQMSAHTQMALKKYHLEKKYGCFSLPTLLKADETGYWDNVYHNGQSYRELMEFYEDKHVDVHLSDVITKMEKIRDQYNITNDDVRLFVTLD